jgi:hypothetical protein
MTNYLGCDHKLGQDEEEKEGICPACTTLYEAGRIVFIEQFMAAYPNESRELFSALYDECLEKMVKRLREGRDVPVQDLQEGGDLSEHRREINL